MQRDELSDVAKEQKFFKFLTASWPGSANLHEYTWTDETDGSTHIRSTDDEGVAQISLSANGFQITVSYLLLLPHKKPQWVEVQGNQSFAASVASAPKDQRRLKMAYEYMKVQ